MVITYSSMKGGVGKTTNAILTATNLAARGFKVLFFDLDTNNSGTMYSTRSLLPTLSLHRLNFLLSTLRPRNSFKNSFMMMHLVRWKDGTCFILTSNSNTRILRTLRKHSSSNFLKKSLPIFLTFTFREVTRHQDTHRWTCI